MSTRTHTNPGFDQVCRLSLSVAAAVILLAGSGTSRAAADPDTSAGPAPHSDSVGAAVGDTAITAKVKTKYLGDDRLKQSHVKVTTTNGVVTLTGRASGSDARQAAEQLAQGVDGVKSVDNQLVTPDSDGDVHQAVSATKRVGTDGWITAKVKTGILADSVDKGSKVHVKTQNGVVVLTGTLPNDDAVAHVKDEAARIQGVKSVDTSGLKSADDR